MLPTTTLPTTAKLTSVFYHEHDKHAMGIVHPDFEAIYQYNLWFEQHDPQRPLLYASFVTSIDGKLAFPDQPQGPLIARENHVDSDGAALDWWILNALRTSCDGLIFGINTLRKEPELTGHIYDGLLQQIRQDIHQQAIPWNILITHHSDQLPLTHQTFYQQAIPLIIITTASEQASCVQSLQACGRTVQLLGLEQQLPLQPTVTYVIPLLDHGLTVVLRMLKRLGLHKILVESPTLAHILIAEQCLDELFMTQSGVYIGGDAVSIGQTQTAFTSRYHPHTKLISIHQHEQSFLYFRYRMIYNK